MVQTTPETTANHAVWRINGTILNRTDELRRTFPNLKGQWTQIDVKFPRRPKGLYRLTVTNPAYGTLFGADFPEIQLSKGKYSIHTDIESNGSSITVSVLLGPSDPQDVLLELQSDKKPDFIQTARIINQLVFFPDPTPVITPPVTQSRVVRRMMRTSNTGKAIVRVISF